MFLVSNRGYRTYYDIIREAIYQTWMIHNVSIKVLWILRPLTLFITPHIPHYYYYYTHQHTQYTYTYILQCIHAYSTYIHVYTYLIIYIPVYTNTYTRLDSRLWIQIPDPAPDPPRLISRDQNLRFYVGARIIVPEMDRTRAGYGRDRSRTDGDCRTRKEVQTSGSGPPKG